MKNIFEKYGFDQNLKAAWDKFWVANWKADGSETFFESSVLMRPASQIGKITAMEMLTTPITTRNDDRAPFPIGIYCNGESILQKHVLEIGSGCAWSGKKIALNAKSYHGLEYSPLASAIGNVVLPENGKSNVIGDTHITGELKSRFDTVVTRNHLVHSNLKAALATAKLAHFSLVKGGLFYGSFFQATPATYGQTIFNANSPLNIESLTSGYDFTRFDIEDLARRAKFKVEAVESSEETLRTHVIFRKHD